MTPDVPRVVTLGETMGLFAAEADGPPRPGARFALHVAGAESNFAIALSRLGVRATWISRLGDDAIGDLAAEALAAEGVDLRWLVRDRAATTGLYVKWRDAGGSRVQYARRHSAASRLAPADVPDAALEGAAWVHLTGITTALSASARATVLDVARRARAAGVPISFDPNYRPALWEHAAAALQAQRELLALADWYLCGYAEGAALFGVDGEETLFDAIAAAGARGAVIRVGARGALLRAPAGRTVAVPPPRLVPVHDEIGAGDGFAAGFAWGLLSGRDPVDAARAGNVVAASALAGSGDWETYVDRDGLLAALKED